MSYEQETTSLDTTCAGRLLGRVKWFNNKAGYGFVTVTDGLRSGTDIFVHHTSIGVQNQQYKYLVQGEYVEFNLTSVKDGAHEFSASDVSGIKGGKLMCETRHESNLTRTNYATPEKSKRFVNDDVPMFRQFYKPLELGNTRKF